MKPTYKPQLLTAEEVELDYLAAVNSNIEERRKLLPITEPERIQALIWNLLTQDNYRERLNYNTYESITSEWFSRFKNHLG